MNALTLPATTSLAAAWRRVGRIAIVCLLPLAGGCAVLDPSGEWRGLDREAPVSAVPAIQSIAQAAERSADPVTASRLATKSSDRPSRSLDARSIEMVLSQAEAHYRNRRFGEAEQGFRAVVEAEPKSLHAWLRLGNLSHARGDFDAARQSYQRASAHGAAQPLEQEAREKALANLAILALEQARVALEGLGGEGHSATAGERARTLSALVEQRQSSLETELRRFGSAMPAPRELDRVGMTLSVAPPVAQASGRPMVRVESFLPDSAPGR